MKRVRRNIILIFTIGLIVLIVFPVMGRLMLNTNWVRSMIKERLEQTLSEQLTGTVTIAALEGDPFNSLRLYTIRAESPQWNAKIDSLVLNYSLFKLIGKKAELGDVQAAGGVIRYTNAQRVVSLEEEKQVNEASTYFAIKDITISDLNLKYSSSDSPKDTSLNINVSRFVGALDTEIPEINIIDFKGVLESGTLPFPFQISSKGSIFDKSITLEDFIVNGGSSLLKGNSTVNLVDSTLKASILASELSLSDVGDMFGERLLEEELDVALTIAGALDSLHIEVTAKSNHVTNLFMVADMNLSNLENPSLQRFGMELEQVDVEALTKGELDAYIGYLRLTGTGFMNLDIQEWDAVIGINGYNLHYEEYVVGELSSTNNLTGQDFDGFLHIIQQAGGGKLTVNTEVRKLWTPGRTTWSALGRVNDIDLRNWNLGVEQPSLVSGKIQISGTGFDREKHPWDVKIRNKTVLSGPRIRSVMSIADYPFSYTDIPSTFADYSLDRYSLDAEIRKESISAQGDVTLNGNMFRMNTEIDDFLSSAPTHSVTIHSDSLDLEKFSGFDIPSSISFQFQTRGMGKSVSGLTSEGRLEVFTGSLNGSDIEAITMDVRLADTFLSIPNGSINSDFVTGTFTGTRNLKDKADPQNRADIDLRIRDLSPLAPFFNTNFISAKGRIRGQVNQNPLGDVGFDGSVQLENLGIGSYFSADSLFGAANIRLGTEYAFDTDLVIHKPRVFDTAIGDIELVTQGVSNEDSVIGYFGLEIVEEGTGSIIQKGTFSTFMEEDSCSVVWSIFDIKTPKTSLGLEHNFTLNFGSHFISSDTLSLVSDEGTFLNAIIPYADSTNQEFWISGANFNIGTIQEIVFGERYLDGVILGEIETYRTGTDLEAFGVFQIKNPSYSDDELDVIEGVLDIESGRLNGQLTARKEGKTLVFGELDVPFRLGEPSRFPPTFFDEEVEGKLTVDSLRLGEFSSSLSRFDIINTDGVLNGEIDLWGTAGSPKAIGNWYMKAPVLSGIEVDSVRANFYYDHETESVTAQSQISAINQEAAQLYANFPLFIDFKTFDMSLPGEKDPILINLTSNSLNLALANDFVNQRYAKRLKGVVDAEVSISGPLNALTPEGFLTVRDASFDLVPLGIELTELSASLEFEDEGLQLKELRARSGLGYLSTYGAIDLDGVIPTHLDLNISSRQFQLSKRRDYTANVDADATLSGPATSPLAKGKMLVNRGSVQIDNLGQQNLETVLLDDENERRFNVYDSLNIDMQIVLEEDFYARSSGYLRLDMKMEGELDARKGQNEELQLYGELRGVDGFVRPLGKPFSIEEAVLQFTGPPEDPDVQITALYMPPAPQAGSDPIKIYYIIEGNEENRVYRFESNPEMDQQDIIAYTLFGRPFYALDGWQQIISGNSASSQVSDLMLEVVLNEVEALATKELGVDVVEIDNTRTGNSSGTSIKTGWYLNERTFFAIINEITSSTPKTLFILEYLLNNKLDLVITQGQDKTGADLSWEFDY